MLRKSGLDGRTQLSLVSLDELVPQDHLVRKIDRAIDFSFIYDLVEDLYSEDNGRPSIDPVVLIKIVFIQCLFGIRSMRQTIREIETNVAYRWFIGYDFTQPIPTSPPSVKITFAGSKTRTCSSKSLCALWRKR